MGNINCVYRIAFVLILYLIRIGPLKNKKPLWKYISRKIIKMYHESLNKRQNMNFIDIFMTSFIFYIKFI